jgi:hypothetical protein
LATLNNITQPSKAEWTIANQIVHRNLMRFMAPL